MSAVSTHPTFMTVQEFEAYPFPDGKVELVRGEPRVMSPAGAPHALVTINLLRKLLPFVDQQRLGHVFTDGLGYQLIAFPNTVRNPDASFVRAGRLSADGVTRGFLKLAPDLAVEVLSPSETARDLDEKLQDYLGAGTRLIWVLNPERRTAQVSSADGSVRWLRGDELLDGADVIPGFTCPVHQLFEGLASEL